MGTEFTAAIEKLASLMIMKAAEGSPPAGGAIVVSHTDLLELMRNDVKLNGVSSYLSWSRRADQAGLVGLEDKGCDGICPWNG